MPLDRSHLVNLYYKCVGLKGFEFYQAAGTAPVTELDRMASDERQRWPLVSATQIGEQSMCATQGGGTPRLLNAAPFTLRQSAPYDRSAWMSSRHISPRPSICLQLPTKVPVQGYGLAYIFMSHNH
jgi:hypothetical protein